MRKSMLTALVALVMPLAAIAGQCWGTTQKGFQCQRWVKDGNYCHDHLYLKYRPAPVSVRIPKVVINTAKKPTEKVVVQQPRVVHTNVLHSFEPVSTNATYHFSESGNFAYGVPDSLGGRIVERKGYAVCFSDKLNLPLWTLYELTKQEVNSGFVSRPNGFIKDPDFPSADPGLYTNSGYDKGHLVPARDVKFSHETMTESFYMANVVPQNHEMNAKIWVRIEDGIRDMAVKYGVVYVGTGPIFCKDDHKTLVSGIPVPDMMFKAIYIPAIKKQICFVVPNSVFYSKADLKDFIVTEQVLGSLIAKNKDGKFSMFPKCN